MSRRKMQLSASSEKAFVHAQTGEILFSGLPRICERIRFYRKKSGMEQTALAKTLGISPNSISNWETGRSRPDVNLLPAICEALNITLYDLFQINDPFLAISEKEKEFLRQYRFLSAEHRLAVKNLVQSLIQAEEIGRLPALKKLILFEKTLAAGIGDPSEWSGHGKSVYVYASIENEKADYIFIVNGDSMEPAFHNGDQVLVQRVHSVSALPCGQIGAFIVGNETYIKRYEKDGLYSLNPRYAPLRFSEDDPVYLIGRVCGTLAPDSFASDEEISRFELLRST